MYLVLFVTADMLDYYNQLPQSSEKNYLWFKGLTLVGVSVPFWFFFLALELSSFMEDKMGYLSDPWNVVDLLGAFLQACILIITSTLILNDKMIISNENLRVIGAIAMFFMWIKNFFWMRIFSKYAHFITLIT